ncbi:MAG: cysteine desulfurase [Acidobacteriota bacterium]|nr:MAG: cysteine desulfurase [Acidobacteriota bacterium]
MTGSIYLDHNATSPPTRGAAEELRSAFDELWGNPSSTHERGRRAREALERARRLVAGTAGASPDEVVFTSGGSEADALAIRGPVEAGAVDRIVISAFEHPAIMDTAAAMAARFGIELRQLPIDPHGLVILDALSDALEGSRRALVSVMLAQNEIGTLQDIAAVSRIAHARGAIVHTDAVQAYGKISVSIRDLDADMMSISAHKMGGPPGAGALVVRGDLPLAPYCYGGGQEGFRRQGTEPAPALIAFGWAADRLGDRMRDWVGADVLRDRFEQQLSGRLEAVKILGAGAPRLANTSAFVVANIEGGAIAAACQQRGLALSAGSACHAGGHGASPIAEALALEPPYHGGLVRVSAGPRTGWDDLERALEILVAAVDACPRTGARGR